MKISQAMRGILQRGLCVEWAQEDKSKSVQVDFFRVSDLNESRNSNAPYRKCKNNVI